MSDDCDTGREDELDLEVLLVVLAALVFAELWELLSVGSLEPGGELEDEVFAADV